MTFVDMAILASSRKPGGRCIAGYDLEGERWIRPVSDLAGGTMTLEHCAVDGDWPVVLDIVRVELADPRPEPWQPENWTLGDAAWQRVGRIEPGDAAAVLREIVNPDVRMLETTNRTINAAALRNRPIDASLTLVEPDSLRWRIEVHPDTRNRQQKAYFSADGMGDYDLQVTDPPAEALLAPLDLGFHDRDAVGIDDDADVFLTISLAEPYPRNDQCYKLAAAVIVAD